MKIASRATPESRAGHTTVWAPVTTALPEYLTVWISLCGDT